MKLASLLLLLPSLGIAQCISDKVIGTLEAATSIGVTENGKYLLKGTISLPKNYLNVSFPFRVMVKQGGLKLPTQMEAVSFHSNERFVSVAELISEVSRGSPREIFEVVSDCSPYVKSSFAPLASVQSLLKSISLKMTDALGNTYSASLRGHERVIKDGMLQKTVRIANQLNPISGSNQPIDGILNVYWYITTYANKDRIDLDLRIANSGNVYGHQSPGRVFIKDIKLDLPSKYKSFVTLKRPYMEIADSSVNLLTTLVKQRAKPYLLNPGFQISFRLNILNQALPNALGFSLSQKEGLGFSRTWFHKDTASYPPGMALGEYTASQSTLITKLSNEWNVIRGYLGSGTSAAGHAIRNDLHGLIQIAYDTYGGTTSPKDSDQHAPLAVMTLQSASLEGYLYHLALLHAVDERQAAHFVGMNGKLLNPYNWSHSTYPSFFNLPGGIGSGQSGAYKECRKGILKNPSGANYKDSFGICDAIRASVASGHEKYVRDNSLLDQSEFDHQASIDPIDHQHEPRYNHPNFLLVSASNDPIAKDLAKEQAFRAALHYQPMIWSQGVLGSATSKPGYLTTAAGRGEGWSKLNQMFVYSYEKNSDLRSKIKQDFDLYVKALDIAQGKCTGGGLPEHGAMSRASSSSKLQLVVAPYYSPTQAWEDQGMVSPMLWYAREFMYQYDSLMNDISKRILIRRAYWDFSSIARVSNSLRQRKSYAVTNDALTEKYCTDSEASFQSITPWWAGDVDETYRYNMRAIGYELTKDSRFLCEAYREFGSSMVNVNKVLQNTGYLPSGYASFLRYVWKEYLGNQAPSGC